MIGVTSREGMLAAPKRGQHIAQLYPTTMDAFLETARRRYRDSAWAAPVPGSRPR